METGGAGAGGGGGGGGGGGKTASYPGLRALLWQLPAFWIFDLSVSSDLIKMSLGVFK